MAKKEQDKKFLDSLERYLTEIDADPYMAVIIKRSNNQLAVFKKHSLENREAAKLLRTLADNLDGAIIIVQPKDTRRTHFMDGE